MSCRIVAHSRNVALVHLRYGMPTGMVRVVRIDVGFSLANSMQRDIKTAKGGNDSRDGRTGQGRDSQ